jgi:hypothetical protein
MCVYGALPVNLTVLKAIPVSNGRSTPILFVGSFHVLFKLVALIATVLYTFTGKLLELC